MQHLVFRHHIFAPLFIMKTISCKTVEWNIVSESIQNFKGQLFTWLLLFTTQFLDLWFISISCDKVHFHLVRKQQLLLFSCNCCYVKHIFLIPTLIFKTCSWSLYTFALYFTRSKRWLYFCISRRMFYSIANSFISSSFLDAFKDVAFGRQCTKHFRTLMLFPLHGNSIS